MTDDEPLNKPNQCSQNHLACKTTDPAIHDRPQPPFIPNLNPPNLSATSVQGGTAHPSHLLGCLLLCSISLAKILHGQDMGMTFSYSNCTPDNALKES
jgi:hypothetical protein